MSADPNFKGDFIEVEVQMESELVSFTGNWIDYEEDKHLMLEVDGEEIKIDSNKVTNINKVEE